MEAPMTPLHDKVLIKRVAKDKMTPGGIILPDSAQEEPSQGVVLACGTGYRLPDGKLEPLDVKAEDKVLFIQGAGVDFKFEGEDYVIVEEVRILGILR